MIHICYISRVANWGNCDWVLQLWVGKTDGLWQQSMVITQQCREEASSCLRCLTNHVNFCPTVVSPYYGGSPGVDCDMRSRLFWVVRQNSTPCQGRALWWSPERAMTLGKNGGRWWAARGWGGVGWAWLMSHGGWWWPARTGNSAWHGPAKCNMGRVDLPYLCVSPVIQTHLQTTAPSLSADPWSARGVQDIESDLELMFEAWVVANKDF